ncbi:hypothetical protein DB88DRAFT_486701 [Papiliotrema laurentii]|uniref:[acyl-carrier-protein] S-malonyltransferase n=1 Tax=Papiliotrema laurentii TaxID=5418 RepID=A0AAD9FR83_PAPLA|nr:hypothetical protein DB88DRAFT_486701 [Papiliotrema laurentii]
MKPCSLPHLPNGKLLLQPSTCLSRRHASYRQPIKPLPQSAPQPYWRRRPASTTTTAKQWATHVQQTGIEDQDPSQRGKTLLFAGMNSYPHTPTSPTSSSMKVWEEASEAVLSPDATIGYWPTGIEEFAEKVLGRDRPRTWMRDWVEGRTLEELMARPDVTAAFILSSSIAILASAQEHTASTSLLPFGTTHLAGHGFIGTLTALVAAGRLDLSTGVRLAMMYASVPSTPPSSNKKSRRYLTTILSARQFHSLSSPPFDIQQPYGLSDAAETSDSPAQRRRAMQLILDEVHAMQREWALYEDEDYAAAAIINSSKVLGVTGTINGVWQVIERLQQLGLANPVMDVSVPAPYHTDLMKHAVPKFAEVLDRCSFRDPPTEAGHASSPIEPVILDPISTHPIGPCAAALAPFLTHQLRWHKTLARLYLPAVPAVSSFHTVGKGARGLGIMLRGELKRRPEGSKMITVEEFGVDVEQEEPRVRRAFG